ncbi:MAG: YihY family inner membrane protein [Gallionella sp.]
MQKDSRDFADFMRFIVTRFSQDRCAQIAGSLTFTTLLSLVPLFTIALTLFSAFPVFENYSTQIKQFLTGSLMPDIASKVITQYMRQFTDSAMRLTALGIGLLAVAAMFLLLTIEHAFNVIWRVAQPRPLLKRLVIHWAALTLAPLLVGVSLALTSWLVGLSMGYVRHVPIFGVGVLKLLPVLLTWLAFAMLFYFLPNRHVPRSHAMLGALVAALAFEAMNRAFGYYVSHFPTYKLVYGAFASVPIFLIWIYLSWLSILLGAVIAASLSYWRTPMDGDASPTAQLLDALRVLRAMTEGLREGRVSGLPELSRSLHLSYDALDEILGKLEQADIICKVEGDGWLMMRDAAHIRTAELLRLFVLDTASLPGGDDGDPLRQWLAESAGRIERDTDISLQELFARSSA